MNTPEHPNQQPNTNSRLAAGPHRRKAVALILVVSFIVLLSALVVSFFSRVTTDLASSRTYAEGVSVRQLADSAIGVVMGQIREATSLENACWASQPGMIRTYRKDAKTPGSDAYAFYKLYSSHDLIVSGTREILAFDPSLTSTSSANPSEVPLGTGGWKQQPAYFTDLNDPVNIPDPKAGANSTSTVKRYPIFDPSVAAIYAPGSRPAKPDWKVEGSEIALSASDRTNNDAPMPVRWMYVLKDGTLTAPKQLTTAASGNTGLVANWSTQGPDKSLTGVPTKDNPIVGRIAFWADDDSCKVNINTAGGFLLPDGVDEDSNLNYRTPTAKGGGGGIEKNPGYYAGSFWDTPRVGTYFDRGINSKVADQYRGGLSNAQPAQNEFQRYPGHPSTTSLGLVFRYLLPPSTGFDSEKLYAMTPRLMPGGSKSGTRYLNTNTDLPLGIKTSYPPPAPDPYVTPAVDPGKDSGYHLFGSVDELFYTATNGARQSAVDGINAWSSGQGWSTTLKPDSISPQMVDQVRFFLTANNRSPELNLFGRPRITMWPVPSASRETQLQSNKFTNASDDLIRFCSTIGRDPNATKQTITRQGEFIFEREDPYSSHTDFEIPRNRELFTYLRTMTSSNSGQVPGFGGSFEQKYNGGPGGRDQILTEIFDYIRTVNQKDGSRDRTIDDKTTPKSAINNNLKTAARYAPHALVVPTRAKIDGKPVSGFGRYPTISEAAIVFYNAGYICKPKAKSDLSKIASGQVKLDPLNDPYKGGIGVVPGNANEVVIYDLDKSPGDVDRTTLAPTKTAIANLNLTSEWAKANVEEWTGKLVRAFLVFETFNPMQGYAPTDNFTNLNLVNTKVKGVDGKFQRYSYADPLKSYFVHELTISSNISIQSPGSGGYKPLTIGGGVPGKTLKNKIGQTSGDTWGGRNFGGTEGFFHTMREDTGKDPTSSNYYVFQSPCSSSNPITDAVRVGVNDTSFDFSGCKMELDLRYEDNTHPVESIQKVTLDFPSATGWPMPTPNYRGDKGGFDKRVTDFDTDNVSAFGSTTRWSTWTHTKYSLPAGWAMPYHLPSRIAWTDPSGSRSNNPYGPTDTAGNITGDGHHYTNRYYQILQPGDTIRSLSVGGGDPAAADPRIAALQQQVVTFKPNPDYTSNTKHRAETLRLGDGSFYFNPASTLYAESPQKTSDPTTGSFITLGSNKYRSGFGPDLVRKDDKGQPFVAKRYDGQAADFDTGMGSFPDGAFAGKADEGNVAAYWRDPVSGVITYVEPYYTWVYDYPLDTYFSPNRQVPGPVMFGSLSAPQTDWAKAGWKTLLFCPNPAGANHPGAQTPPDHLLLDLFTMPVVEPYAISEPFSTAGKVNLNYPMVPFSYIKRTTALRAALHPLRVTAIPQSFVDGSKQFKYKGYQDTNKEEPPENLRYLVDRDETLKAFDAFFDQYKTNKNGGFFKSASQICERFLYPKGTVYDGSTVKYTTGEGAIKAFWNNNQLTGDNVREKPYADLYPRITTKSNTYTIHYRVQSLRQRPYAGAASGADAYYRTFDESRDQIMSELRGQATIERYLDPEDARFQASHVPATERIDVEKQALETAYRFRIIANKRFSPW